MDYERTRSRTPEGLQDRLARQSGAAAPRPGSTDEPTSLLPLPFVYHKFDADRGGADFGQESDTQLSRRLGRNWALLLKHASCDGGDAPYAYQVQKLWAQAEFNF